MPVENLPWSTLDRLNRSAVPRMYQSGGVVEPMGKRLMFQQELPFAPPPFHQLIKPFGRPQKNPFRA